MFPGVVAPDGEEVDVEKHILQWQEKNPKNGAKNYTDQEIKDMFFFLRGNDKPFLIKEYSEFIEPAEEKTGKSNVGIDMPQYLQNGHESGYIR